MGSTVRRIASTSPSGHPSRKQSLTGKSKWPGLRRLALLPGRGEASPCTRLVGRWRERQGRRGEVDKGDRKGIEEREKGGRREWEGERGRDRAGEG